MGKVSGAVLREGVGCCARGGYWVLCLGRRLGSVIGGVAECCTSFQLCCWGLVLLEMVPVLEVSES